VSPESVILDSVELTFRDQYLGRSEMWRLRNSMIDTCVYNNKKMEFCGGYTRVQVYQMWTKGKIVSCGVISHNTKVLFIVILQYEAFSIFFFKKKINSKINKSK